MILFLDDWQDYPDAIVHASTENQTFLHIASVLKTMGIKNHVFMLALHNPELEKIDPHSNDLTNAQLEAVVEELCVNPWYFFREVIRAPAKSATNAIRFRMNRANLAAYFMFFNHVLFCLLQPRQTGKSFSIDNLLIYLLNYGTRRTEMNLLTRSDELRTRNFRRLKNIQDEIPELLNYKTKNDIFNTTSIQLEFTGNMVGGALSNASAKMAAMVGRGFTSPIFYGDEVVFVRNIRYALPAALMAGNEAREIARTSGAPYGTMLASTSGDLDDEDAAYIYSLLSRGCPFTDKLYDAENEDHLRELILNNCTADQRGFKRPMVDLTFDYLQLGYDDKWMLRAIEETMADGLDADRDLFNKWTSGSKTPPLPRDVLDRIHQSIVMDFRPDFAKDYGFLVRWYIDEDELQYLEDRDIKIILGLDTSDASGSDDIALVFRGAHSGEVLGTSAINNASLSAVAGFVADLLIDRPNLILVPERKSSAAGIIDIIIARLCAENINPFHRIFNTVFQDPKKYEKQFEILKNIKGYNYDVFIEHKKHLGFVTSGFGATSRDNLYGVCLRDSAKYTAELTKDKQLCGQILGLIIKNGRIDHPEGGKDDLVIAYLLSYWFLTQARNLHLYGIDASKILHDNDVYLEEKYSDSAKSIEESRVIEEQIDEVTELLKECVCPYTILRMEGRLKRLTSDINNNYAKTISLDQLLDEINKERRRRKRH